MASIVAGEQEDVHAPARRKYAAMGITTAAQGRLHGLSIRQCQLIFSLKNAEEFKAAGFTARECYAGSDRRQELSYLKELKDAYSLTMKECQDVGFHPTLCTELFSLDTAEALHSAGFSVADCKNRGFTLAQCKDAGFTANECTHVFGSSSVKELYSLTTVAHCRASGFTPAECARLFCLDTAEKCKAVEFTASDCRDAGFSIAQCRAIYSLTTVEECQAAGFGAKACKDAGFTASDCKPFYPLSVLYAGAGFSKAELLQAGFLNNSNCAGCRAADQCGYGRCSDCGGCELR